MKKIAIFTIALLLTGGIGLSFAEEIATFQWSAPTHRIANEDCDQQGTALTPEEIASLTYTLSYRVSGSSDPWMNVSSTTPTASVTLPGYSVEYVLAVGASLPGGEIMCSSDPVLHTTGPDTNPPGACTDLRKVAQ